MSQAQPTPPRPPIRTIASALTPTEIVVKRLDAFMLSSVGPKMPPSPDPPVAPKIPVDVWSCSVWVNWLFCQLLLFRPDTKLLFDPATVLVFCVVPSTSP